MFSGLPCQVYALKKYLYNKSYLGDLVTCDLICNGVPSYKLLEEGTTLANIKREQDNLINNFIDKLDKEYRDLSNCKKIILDAIKNLNQKFNSKQG